MDYADQQRSWGKHAPSLLAVVVLHVLIAWALVSGLARKVIEVIKAPIETKIIEEIKKPPPDLPPPPPPPKLAAPPPPFIPPPEINIQVPQVTPPPTITTQSTTPPPPGPPPVYQPQVVAPPQPAVRREYKATYCPKPVFPRQAQREGITGSVTVHVYVSPAGGVTDVKITRSTNRVFNREVVRAFTQCKYAPEPVGFIGEYEVEFNLKD